MKRTIFTLVVVVAMMFSCMSGGNKQEDANLSNDSIPLEEEMVEEEVTAEGVAFTGTITDELLWEIFTKIPIDSMSKHGLFKSEKAYLKAKADGKFNQYREEGADCKLEYEIYNREGIGTSLTLGGFPTNDGNKIIVVFFIQGHFDAVTLFSDQTYEYDLATRKLKPIKRPEESITLDDFIDKSDFTPQQVKDLQKSFKGNCAYAYAYVTKNGYVAYWSDIEVFYEDDEELDLFYDLKITWNGERFIKERVREKNQ